ncbi:MAG: restriction endonuclease subunit S [Treponema sp.]|nr:restriction endonuclease subunit S [Treponema sp.]
MKKDWQIKKLGEVCNIIGGTTPSTTNKSYWNGTEKWITPAEIDINKKYIFDSVRHITTQAVKDCSLQLQPKGTVIFTSRAPIGKVAISEMDFYCNQGFKNFVCSEEIFNEYLYYFLLKNVDYLNSIGKGTTFKEISKTVISQVQIPLPPLEEQKRIVAVLDKKFAQIETLKTAAEKNLQNTKQLFQAELEKAFSNTSWETQLFSDLFKLTSGEYLNSKSIIKGQYPIYGGNGIIAYHNEYNLTGDNIIIGRVGALCGNVRFLSEPIWLTDNAFKLSFLKDPFDYKFLTYLLNFKDLRKYARQAAQPVISNSSLKDIEIPLPPLEEQKRIVAHLDSLSEKVHQLEEIYTKQLADCDELKQSLLQKAFEGEL